MTTNAPDAPQSTGPTHSDDPYPARCAGGHLLMTDGQRRAHCGPCPAYDGDLEPVTINDPEEAER
jgi:hypothetical protein